MLIILNNRVDLITDHLDHIKMIFKRTWYPGIGARRKKWIKIGERKCGRWAKEI